MVPITSLALAHKASTDRVSTGIAALDEMMEGKGFFRGSSVLVTGTAGTGKSSLAASFASAAWPVAKIACISLLKSLPARFSVTCARLALTWSAGWKALLDKCEHLFFIP